jgi:chromosome condensin MukBEF MukE localization factor
MPKEEIFNELKTLVDSGALLISVKEKVTLSPLDDMDKQDILQSITTYFYERQRKEGFKLIGIGTAVLIISFLFTVVLFHNNYNIELLMYISSILGLSIAFWGCTKVL